MNILNDTRKTWAVVNGLLLLAFLCLLNQKVGATEQTFDVLTIGTRTYTNVTVTTKAKSYVFLLHSAGMANIKVSELTVAERQKLGYPAVEEQPVGKGSAATKWAREKFSGFKIAEVQARSLTESLKGRPAEELQRLQGLDRKVWYEVAGVLLVLHLFHSFCLMLICRKTGKEPGILIWLPLFQIFPLLRAAGMSLMWFFAFFIPLLNLLALLILPFKIAKARGKSAWAGFFLLLPVTSPFVFLYLAFSDGEPAEKVDRRGSNIMSLETA